MSYSEQMLDALAEGNVDQANLLFRSVLEHDDDETKYNLAEELYALGFTGQAKRLYQELMGRYPDQDDIKTVLADIAVSDGDPDAALNYLSKIQPDSEAYLESLVTAADVYQTQGMYEVSEQKLLQAQAIAPDEPVIAFALGELYFDWGHYPQAQQAYAQLLAAGETELAGVDVQARLAATLAQLGQYEDAIATYEADGINQLDLNNRFQLGGLYYLVQDYRAAIDAFSGVLEQDQSFASAYLPLAQAYVADNQPDMALETIQDGVMVDDTNPDLYALGADLAIKAEQNDLAENYLQKALAIDPENLTNALAWSNYLYLAERDEDNIAFLNGLDQEGEVDPQINWNLAKSEARLDEIDQAREHYLLAFNRLQTQPDFLHDIIDFFQMTGAIDETKAAMQRYLQLVPDDLDMQERYDRLIAD
ncbi:tetratricopeptide repeat protein [Lacticaseibacillus brantae]|uniref:TPR repeats containing protein n=1 Tax=Lacticaseibacillus brantae DSM 23927 TaxID=1423727 RepID=A0A0R2BA56_9LACO|nr:tetratricopeptide repeat protein [Lacticaseibacillus brantae]KRM72604.1 tPR repeats containing protein [Lacticaseibacillus brantae DSM 23927]